MFIFRYRHTPTSLSVKVCNCFLTEIIPPQKKNVPHSNRNRLLNYPSNKIDETKTKGILILIRYYDLHITRKDDTSFSLTSVVLLRNTLPYVGTRLLIMINWQVELLLFEDFMLVILLIFFSSGLVIKGTSVQIRKPRKSSCFIRRGSSGHRRRLGVFMCWWPLTEVVLF